MDWRGSNLPAVGEYNQTVVLDAIRRQPAGTTRPEIAALTRLSGMTVTNVCRRLLEEGLIFEDGTRINGPGKPAMVIRLDPDGGFAIGVHIDPAVVTYVLLDLAGVVRDHSRSGTPDAQDPEAVIAGMASAIEALIDSSGVERSRIIGIGIATPGPINVEEGVVLNPPMLPYWHRVALRRSLSQATGMPVLLEKDVTAAVVAELWYPQPERARDFAFLYYGTGFGAGIAVGGEVVRGTSSNAGDPGHMTVDPDGPLCVCGRRGCVGYSVVPRVLVEQALEAGVLDGLELSRTGATPEIERGFEALAELARAGEGPARDLVVHAARDIARAAVVVVNLLDVEQVVFGGPFWAPVADLVLDVLPRAVAEDPALVVPHPVAFVGSGIPVDVAAVGAATLVLDNAFSPKPAALLLSGD